MTRDSGDPGGDSPLHIDRAAPNHLALMDLGAKGIVTPQMAHTGRHHIGMAGEAEIGRRRTATGIEIFNVAEFQPRTDKSQVFQHLLNGIHGAGVGRGNRRPCNKRLC